MANLQTLAPITTAATALSNLVLVSPQATQGYQPQNPNNPDGTPSTATQPPALLFHYEGEQVVALQSDVTDHFIEDNTAIQDQVALRPEKITTHGFIGELNNVSPKILQFLKSTSSSLTAVGAYVPRLTTSALIAYNEAFFLYQVASSAANSAVSAWSSLTGSGENVIGSGGIQSGAFNPATGTVSNNQTKQQIAFQQFYGYWRARTLFTVQTPWAVFQNMIIETLRAIQDAETRMITDFEITFKMIRTAQTAESAGIAAILQGRAAQQAAGLTDLGTSTPAPSIPLSAGLSQMGVG